MITSGMRHAHSAGISFTVHRHRDATDAGRRRIASPVHVHECGRFLSSRCSERACLEETHAVAPGRKIPFPSEIAAGAAGWIDAFRNGDKEPGPGARGCGCAGSSNYRVALCTAGARASSTNEQPVPFVFSFFFPPGSLIHGCMERAGSCNQECCALSTHTRAYTLLRLTSSFG